MAKNNHLSFLDSIRGLAALFVIMEHFNIAYGLPCLSEKCHTLLDSVPFNFWWDGGAAVSMFFVLSGLVLSLKYFRHGSSPDLAGLNLPQYIISRLARLWPPYLFVLAVSAFFYSKTIYTMMPLTALPAQDWIHDLWHSHILTKKEMVEEALLFAMPDHVILIPQAWTLALELIISMLIPLGLILADYGLVWLFFFGALAVTSLGVPIYAVHFLFGLIIAKYFKNLQPRLESSRLLRWMLFLTGIAFYTSGGITEKLGLPEPVVWLGTGIGSALILLYAIGSKRTQEILSFGFLKSFGKVSYSAYLVHMLVLICATPYFLKAIESVSTRHSFLWTSGLLFTIATTYGLSILSYQYIEMNSVSLGRYLIKRMSIKAQKSNSIK